MSEIQQEDEVCRGAMQAFIRRATDLYSLPAVAMQVLELTESPSVDARALKNCIENDPALTSKLLRVVNSSLFGLRGEVTDLNQAIALLGIKPLRMLVLSFNLPRKLFQGVEAEVLSRYWTHSLVKAVTCREMARRFWGSEGDDAFVAGLLQELGVLVLLQRVGDSYSQFLSQVHNDKGRLADLETSTLGFDHLAVTSGLLSHWNFPASLTTSVAANQSIAAISALPESTRDLAQILHLSELLAEVLIGQKSGAIHELVDAAAVYKEIGPTDLEPLLADLEETIPDLAAVLNLEVEDGDYRNILADAHVRLGETTEQWLVTEGIKEAQSNLSTAFRQLQQEKKQAAEQIAATETTIDPPRSKTVKSQPAIQSNSTADPANADFLGRVADMIAKCRQQRCCLTLVLAQIDHYQDWILRGTIVQANQLVGILYAGATAILPEDGVAIQSGEGQVALLLPDTTASEGIEAARKLSMFLLRGSEIKLSREATASIGVATMEVPPRNFPPAELTDAANRCITAAQQHGGGQVKSIQVL
jgi:HD-like signal output (HDOD) protein/GGDEF domain-containing protein